MRLGFRALPLLAAALLLGTAGDAFADGVTGAFRLAKASYCVGEPILVEFTVVNGSSSTFKFAEGGDYRGTLRHDRFSFRIVNAAGRDFTQELWGNYGGLGHEVEVARGETVRSLQLLNGWTHLLPPGKYRVQCGRKLWLKTSGDGKQWTKEAEPVDVRQELAFEVTPYRRSEIAAAVAAMHEMERANDGAARFVVVPVEWTLADLQTKFEIEVDESGSEAVREKTVLAGLPKVWEDRWFIEYELKANRNWLTYDKPEDFVLTFTARNNGLTDLPHRFAESSLTVNGAAPTTWSAVLKKLIAERKLGDLVSPGAVAEITGRFNDILPTSGKSILVWKIQGATRSVDVRFGQ